MRPLLSRLTRDLDPMRLCAMGMIIVTLSSVHQHLGPLAHTRPSFTLLLLAGAIAIVTPRAMSWRTLRESWTPKAVGAFFALCLGSALFGLSLGGSVAFIIDRYWKVLVFYLALTLAIKTPRHLALLTWAYVLAIVIISILGFTVVDMTPTREGLARLSGNGMFDSNDLAMVLLMGVPMALLLLLNSKGTLARLVCVAGLIMVPMILAKTGSRGALIGAVLVAIALFFALRRISIGRRIIGSLCVFGALAFAAPAGYWEQMGTTFDTEGNYNYVDDYGRIALAKRGMGYMLRYPVFGVGISNFGRAEWSISPIAADRGGAGRWISPHNTFVQVGAETGIPGFLLWLGMLAGGSLGLLSLRKRIPVAWEQQSAERRFLREATLFLPISTLAFATTSFFLTHAYTPPVYALLALIGGLVMLVRRELALDARPGVSQPARVARRSRTPGPAPAFRVVPASDPTRIARA